MKKEDISKFQAAIQQTKKIAVVSHFNPDGDALGSSLAIYHYFREQRMDVSVIIPNQFPNFLYWMPGSDQIIVAQRNITKARKAIKEADMLFIVDMNAPHRAGQDLESPIIKSKAFKVLIDHHMQPDIECDIMYTTHKTSSACELVFNFLFKYIGPKQKCTKPIAESLYVGIITDTGSLTYACNQPNTYTVLRRLISAGIDGEAIHRKVYDNYTESRMKLLGLALSKRFSVIHDYHASHMYLTRKDLVDNNFKIGDTEGFVNYGLSVSDVEFTAFFTERDDRIRISFRSKGTVDVNLLARKYFNGGGHHNAAGAFYIGDIKDAIKIFEKAAKESYEEYFSENL